jgi:hypothetical protein
MPISNMENMNSKEELNLLLSTLLDNIKKINPPSLQLNMESKDGGPVRFLPYENLNKG